MADVTINYEGNAIATMSASGTKTLLTEGKYCTDDIEVVYVSPGGGGGLTYENGTFTPVSNTLYMDITGLNGVPKFIKYCVDDLENTGSGGGLDGTLKTLYGSYVLGGSFCRITNSGGGGYGGGYFSPATGWESNTPTIYADNTQPNNAGEIYATATGFSAKGYNNSYPFRSGYTYNWGVWY